MWSIDYRDGHIAIPKRAGTVLISFLRLLSWLFAGLYPPSRPVLVLRVDGGRLMTMAGEHIKEIRREYI